MSRLFARVVLLTIVVCAEILVTGPAAWAKGADPCPEPNDTFQAACYLGPGSDALGFISAPSDVDAYRFEALDFGVKARLELADMPGPYRLNLADWNGRIVAESSDQGGVPVLEYTLGPPGSYYVFVDSGQGAASDTVPYRLTTELTYARAIPTAQYAEEFRSADPTPCDQNYMFLECYARDGRFVISFEKFKSSPQISPNRRWGPDLDDFMLVVDSRVTGNGDRNTVFIEFRVNDEDLVYHRYRLRIEMNTLRPGILLKKESRNGNRDLLHTDAYTVGELTSVDTRGGVNRSVIRAIGDEITININGVEAARLNDNGEPGYPAFVRGRFGFGASALGEPPVITFDNILITTP